MITPQERKYRELMLQWIVYEYQDHSMRGTIINDFIDNSNSYYEHFCDMVYQYVQNSINNLLINNHGISFLDQLSSTDSSVLLLLSKDEEIIPCYDIIIYIDVALDRLQKQVERQLANSNTRTIS